MRKVVNLLFSFLLLHVAFGNASAVYAQDAQPASLRITKVDTSNFPEVNVYLAGENLGAELGDVPVKLTENGSARTPSNSTVTNAGIQLALVLDASGSVRDPGLTKDPRYVEVGNVARRLAAAKALSPQTDWLATFSTTKDGKVQTLKDWTRDHQAAVDSLYVYQPDKQVQNTPLFNLLYFTLNSFSNSNIPSYLQKTIVIFSDGVDVVSSLELNDAVQRASNMGVKVHTVMLGPGTPETTKNLQRIATLTSGNYYQLNNIQALDGLWPQVAAGRNQRVISYRSQTSDPKEVSVTATLPNKQTLQVTVPIPAGDIRPVQVQIRQPASNFSVSKTAPAYNTPLTDLDPKTLDVKVEFSWPDNHARQINRVEYTLDTETVVCQSAPFDQATLPMDTLGDGSHTLKVRAFDEFGLVGESQPLTFPIAVDRPVAPLPPPQADPKALLEQLQRQRLVSLLALALGLLALLLAVYVWRRNPEMRERVSEAFSGTLKAMTEPFVRRSKKAKADAPKAYLVVEEGDASLPPVIELTSSNTRIGRDSSLSNVVINDRRISRYHARISQEADNSFRVWDEGSTGGTFINDEKVGMSGQVLHPGDHISVGPVTFRFQTELDKRDQNPFHATEPEDYQPSRRAASRLEIKPRSKVAPAPRPAANESDEEDEEETTAPFPL